MKKLTIVRHAKSSWEFPGLSDFDRPLNKRGRRDAQLMANHSHHNEIQPDLFLTSPASRAVTTARIFASAMNYVEQQIQMNTTLYHASPLEILVTLKTQLDEHNHIILFGHNPGLTEFINQFGNLSLSNLPTSGLVSFSLKTETWASIQFKMGVEEHYFHPKSIS